MTNVSLADLRTYRDSLEARLAQVDEAIAALERLGGLEIPSAGSKPRVARTTGRSTGSKKKPAKSREALLLDIIAKRGDSIPVKEVLQAMTSAGYTFNTQHPKLNWLYTPRGKGFFSTKDGVVRAKK